MPGYAPTMPHFGPSLNFQEVRNFNVSDQGHSRSGYPRSHRDHHDSFQGETTHTSHGVSHGNMYSQALRSSSLQPGTPAGYDTAPHASQQPPMGPRHPTESVQIYSVQSADASYPLGFVRQQSPRDMNLAWPSSQGSTGAWNPWAGSYSFQSTSESHSHHPPGGFVFQQGVRCETAAFLSQLPASVQSALGGPYSTTLATKKRKALVIGTNHPLPSDPRDRLECCTRDAHCVADFLHDKLGFARNDIRIITDDNPGDLPTKENILEAMRTLVRGAQPDDSFFFYFSGHGIQIKDMDGDESDGLDECICAMDYRGDDPHPDSNTAGLIVDDTMHDIMVKPLPQGCRLTAIFDCCHSGTILDLPVIYNSKGAAKPFIHLDGPWIWSQKISSADVASISASKDNQEAAESRQGGVLQRAFIDSVSKFGDTLTYKGLIRNMRDYMRRRGFEQKPQLSTSYKIDTNLRFVV